METPWLVQRCKVSNEKLEYDYMGSSEFKFGAQSESLERIFAKGLFVSSTTVRFGGKEEGKDVKVFIVTGTNFPVSEYQPYLQKMAENEMRLKEWTLFNDAIRQQLGVKRSWNSVIRNNVWFDLDNDVLWTLTEKNQKRLVAHLERIKQLWAEKKAAHK